MFGRFWLCLALLVGFGGAATFAPGAQAATALSVATPADDVAHPGSQTEWWYFSVLDPASSQTLIVSYGVTRPSAFQGLLQPNTVTTFWYGKDGTKTHAISPTTPYVTTNTPSISSSAGGFTWDPRHRGGAYHFKLSANGINADVWLEHGLPGVTGGPLDYDGQSMYWTNPVATSVASGWVRPAGSLGPISVNGWRGYHDHNYGAFDLTNQSYSGWEWALSHHPDGSSWVMGGVVAGDGGWQGVLVQARPSGTRFCRTTIALSNWATKDTFNYPGTVRATCPGEPSLTQSWKVTGPHVFTAPSFTFTEALGKTSPGSVGLIEHFRTWSHLS